MIKSKRGTKFENLNLERKICSGLLKKLERGYYKSSNKPRMNFSLRCEISLKIGNDYRCLWNLIEINRVWYPHEIASIKKSIKSRTNTLSRYQELYKGLQEMKNEYKEQGLDFNLIQVFGEEDFMQYVNLDINIDNVEKRIANLNDKLKQYEKEYAYLCDHKLKEKVSRWERQFRIKHGNAVASKLLPIIDKYGSKQARLISYVRELLNETNGNNTSTSNKIIIFSLFGDVLKDIQSRLDMIGIKSSKLIGNVYSRQRAMSAFQTTTATSASANKNTDSKTRVILVSIKHAASGANLTEATHVILCDAVPGSSSEAYSYERQAVGRVVRQGMSLMENGKVPKVVRLVVKHSIEHETHERNENIRKQQNNEMIEFVEEMDMKIEEQMKKKDL